MSPPRILYVEDNISFRDLVVSVLEKGGFTCAVAGDGQEALEKAEEYLPDLVLLDRFVPRMVDLEICQRLRAMSDMFIVVYTAYPGRQAERDLYGAGVDDFLSKMTPPDILVAHLHAVLRRGRSPVADASDGPRPMPDSTAHPPPALTPRQRGIACLLTQGKSNKEIGAALSISDRTVATILGEMFFKYDAGNRTELVAKLMSQQR